ncbi:MAG: alpha-1,2-fucosyltransferase [Thiohalocapsa sp.]
MIIVRTCCGLGNQMFQYALGRHLALLRNTELKIDTSPYSAWYMKVFNSYSHDERYYGLDVFSIDAGFANHSELWQLRKKHIGYLARKSFLRSRQKEKTSGKPTIFFDKTPFRFNPEVFSCGKDAIFTGFWQNEKYFEDIDDVLRDDFRFRQEPDSNNHRWLDRIRTENSISVHVRRGDYEKVAGIRRTFGLCAVDYYHNSLSCIGQRVTNPVVYVFSDDPDWAESNIEMEFPAIFMRHNKNGKDHEDLRLMSNCKHNIIANSTFSWWAAWLNENEKKIVIAPRKWTNEFDYSNAIIPSRWITI